MKLNIIDSILILTLIQYYKIIEWIIEYELLKYNISMFRLRRYMDGPITRYIV